MKAYRIINRSACNEIDCTIGNKLPLITPVNPISDIKRRLEATFEERRKILFPNLTPRRSGPFAFPDLRQEVMWAEAIFENKPQDYYLTTLELNNPTTWFDASFFNQAGNEAVIFEKSNNTYQENYLNNERIVAFVDSYWKSGINTDNPTEISYKLAEGIINGDVIIVNCETKHWNNKLGLCIPLSRLVYNNKQ